MDRIKSLPLNVPRTCNTRTKIDSRRWDRCRAHALQLRREEAATLDVSLCEHCEMEGKQYTLLAVDCHHRIPRSERPDLTYVLSNLQFLCKGHHSLRTKLEQVDRHPNRYVVTGPPGVGKTTYVKTHCAARSLIWDADVEADRLGMGAYPRSESDEIKLRDRRSKFIRQAEHSLRDVWMILRWPTTAYRIAIRLGAKVIEIRKPSWRE